MPTFDIIVSNSTAEFDLRPPSLGEITDNQGRVGHASGMFADSGGFRPPPKSTFSLYRRMRGNPTIAMARIAAFAPVKASAWSVVSEGANDAQRQFVEDQIIPLRSRLLSDLAFALDFGFAAFEKVWAITSDGGTRLVVDKLKALKPEKTEIQVLETTGGFAGIKNEKTLLGPSKCFVFTNDREVQDYYGRSRHENIKREYMAWEELLNRIGVLAKKVSGSIPIIKYPEGSGQDASGRKQSNADNAMAILNALSSALGVTMPNTLSAWAQQFITAGVDVKQLGAWDIDFLESSSGHATDLLAALQHLEKLMVRGWYVPERATTEATLAGSRADSEQALDLAFLVAEDVAGQIDDAVNRWLVNPILLYNFGAAAVDTVRVEHQPVMDDAKRMIAGIDKEVLVNPNNIDLLTRVLDFDAMLDRAELPRQEDVGDVLDELETTATKNAVAEVTKALGEMQGPQDEQANRDDQETAEAA